MNSSTPRQAWQRAPALRTALARGELVVALQPQQDLVSGAVIGVEALARWHHPEHGQVSPADFLPVAESTGLTGALTATILDSALAHCHQWQSGSYPDLGVSVNVSPRALADDGFPTHVLNALKQHRVAPSRLTLEVTETGSVRRDPRVTTTLHAIADAGVRVCLDDFGTGDASLLELNALPVDEIKIDRLFVAGLPGNRVGEAVCAALAELGRRLGAKVVAEGVETEACKARLIELGCTLGQGFLLSRPLAPADFLTWLNVHHVGAFGSAPVQRAADDLTRASAAAAAAAAALQRLSPSA